MVDYIRQIKARLVLGEDEELNEILNDFAVRVEQSALIRLALYRLLGLDVPPSLYQLDDEFDRDGGIPQPAIAPDLAETLGAAIERMGSTIAQALANQPRPTLRMAGEIVYDTPMDDGIEVKSSGLDMSRDRPRPKARSLPAQPAQIEAGADDELPDNWQVVLAQQMARNIPKPGDKLG